MAYSDGEVIGLDNDGCILQWDAEIGETYNCGETPEEFGTNNLTGIEAYRIKVRKKKAIKDNG